MLEFLASAWGFGFGPGSETALLVLRGVSLSLTALALARCLKRGEWLFACGALFSLCYLLGALGNMTVELRELELRHVAGNAGQIMVMLGLARGKRV